MLKKNRVQGFHISLDDHLIQVYFYVQLQLASINIANETNFDLGECPHKTKQRLIQSFSLVFVIAW